MHATVCIEPIKTAGYTKAQATLHGQTGLPFVYTTLRQIRCLRFLGQGRCFFDSAINICRLIASYEQ